MLKFGARIFPRKKKRKRNTVTLLYSMDQKRKLQTLKSTNKRTRVLSMDTFWCLNNKENLNVMLFAKQFGYINQAKCHQRYKCILDNYMPDPDKLRLQEEFSCFKNRLISKEFWREQAIAGTLADANADCLACTKKPHHYLSKWA